MPKRPVSVKRLQTMEKKLRGNSIADLRKVGQVILAEALPRSDLALELLAAALT